MSLRDILLDRVKDKLYYDLHYESLVDQLGDKISGDQHNGTLKKWGSDRVSDIVDAAVRANKETINKLIDEKVKQENLNLTTLDDSLIEAVAEKIEYSLLILDDKTDPYVGLPNVRFQLEFPFNTRSLLQMCWGMTLNISHEQPQRDMGGVFKEQFTAIWKQISRLDVDFNDSTGIFLMNLQMALSSTIRNLGFIRATHTDYLNYNGDRLSKRRQNLEQIADFASFSGSGLFAKLGSFAGFGSVAELVTSANSAGIPLVWVPIFIIGGIAGAFVVTILTRFYVARTDDSWDRKVTLDQNRYFKEHYKKDVTNELFNLYISIIGLIEKFYPDKKNEIMDNDELLSKRNDPESVKDIIKKFLVPDNIQWFPIFTAPQTSAQTQTS